MSDFTSRIDGLMTNKNISRYRFCIDTGVPESTYRAWIKGAKPSAKTALLVADYFNVPLEYLIEGKNPPTAATELILDDSENELIDIYRSLDQRGRETLLNLAKALEPKK